MPNENQNQGNARNQQNASTSGQKANPAQKQPQAKPGSSPKKN